jgi:hypothetical protein
MPVTQKPDVPVKHPDMPVDHPKAPWDGPPAPAPLEAPEEPQEAPEEPQEPREDDTDDEASLWSVVNGLVNSFTAFRRGIDTLSRRVDDLAARPVPTTERVIKLEGLPVPPQTPEAEADISHKAMHLLIHNAHRSINSFIYGEAGTGKSHAAAAVARALGIDYYECILGPADTGSKIVGVTLLDGTVTRTPVREAWENGGLILFDEVCTANPAILTMLNNAFETGYLNFPDGRIKRHADCRIILADNTDGETPSTHYATRRVLDPAFRSRFARFAWDRDEALEVAVATSRGAGDQAAVDTCLAFYRKVRAREWPCEVSARSLYLSVQMYAHSDLDFETEVKPACYPARVLQGLN